MKLMVKMTLEGPVLILKYHPDEWRLLEMKWQELGLERRMSQNLWGVGWQGEFYRERNAAMEGLVKRLFEAEGLRYHICSDINSPVLQNGRVNVGILRVVPDPEHYTVKAPLPELINIEELINIRNTLANAIRLILRVVTSAECEIKFFLNGKPVGGDD